MIQAPIQTVRPPDFVRRLLSTTWSRMLSFIQITKMVNIIMTLLWPFWKPLSITHVSIWCTRLCWQQIYITTQATKFQLNIFQLLRSQFACIQIERIWLWESGQRLSVGENSRIPSDRHLCNFWMCRSRHGINVREPTVRLVLWNHQNPLVGIAIGEYRFLLDSSLQ